MNANNEYAEWEAFKKSAIQSGGEAVTGAEIAEVLPYSGGAWVLSHDPVSVVRVFCNGARYTEIEDYTLDGRRVVPVGAWPVGPVVVAEYRY